MRRLRTALLILLAAIILLPMAAVAAILLGLNTAPGRRLAESQIAALTGNAVQLTGLAGRFPDHLTLARLNISDAAGPWLTLTNVALDWSPTALLHKQALIHNLTADRIDLPRLSTPDPAAKPTPATPLQPPFQLPVRVTVEHLTIARATIGAPLLGTTATVALTGKADLPTLQTGSADLSITRQDSPGTYTLTAAVTPDRTEAHLTVQEPEGGLIARLATLPNLGPLAIKADIAGPQSALNTTLTLSAGPLTATASGLIDLPHATLAADIQAQAPAMRPADGVSWQAIDLKSHVAGPFTAPEAAGHLQISGLQAQGAGLQTLAVDLSGNAGQIQLKALATALTIPGPRPNLLAASPLAITLSARLDDPTRPIAYTLAHPLIAMAGTATTGANLAADATLTLPDLHPLTEIANLDLAGHTTLKLHAAQTRTGTPEGTTTLSAEGRIGLTAGSAPAPLPIAALIGPDAAITIQAHTAGTTVTVDKATIAGTNLTLDAHGQTTPEGVDVVARLGLGNLAILTPTLLGQATLDMHAHGPLDAVAMDATLSGEVGASGVPRGPVRITLAATGLPTKPAGRIDATGTFQNAPINLALSATRDAAGALQATIERADWRSLHAEGALTLPAGATLPQGRIALRMPQLADLRPLIGQPIAGALTATIALDPAAATIDAELRNTGIAANHLGHALLHARIADPTTRPVIAAQLTLDGIAASGTTGSARIEATGPQDVLSIRTTASLVASGTPATLSAAALLNATARQLRLDTLQVEAKPPSLAGSQTIRLQAPATLKFAVGVSIDRLRLAINQATLEAAGQFAPALNATVQLRANASDLPTLATEGSGSAAPKLDGTITLDARLAGTPAQPSGTIKLLAANLHARSGPAQAAPPATITATAQLASTTASTTAHIDARLVAGSANLAVNGQAPIGPGALNLRATGGLDLALLDPILTAQGRRARGRLTLDATITGPAASPALAGQAQLAGGEIQDFVQGLRLTDIAAILRAEGQSVRIASLTAKAGPGTISATGTIGALAPGLPLDLVVTARNARPLASDTISADLDADLTLKGPLAALQAGGKVTIRRAELNIPTTLPASVAVLPVRRPGDKPAPTTPTPPTAIGLDLTVAAPGQVFLRGRGVDAEMAGTLRIHGTSTQPQVNGGLDMRRGSISVAGTTLTFSRGKVGFDGTGVSGKIDPTLDFAADSAAAGVTATLAIGGYVSKPRITLSAVPDLPQDEVLAYLIFKRSAKELGPFQIAQIAAGLAELTGVGGGGFNPLETVRKGLGLDRLSVGSSTTSGSSSAAATPTIEAGRYVANGVYVGAKQGTSGNQTQATVQIDITKGLKVETDVGTGQGGNQVGLTYQFEY